MSTSSSSNSQLQFPKKDQAIILNAINDNKLTDYVVAVGNIVQPKNVLFASRISNNRICIYLKEKSLVDELVSKHPNLTINNQEVGIRRFITPAQRIIISNVCPSIPHDVILSLIKGLGYKPVSPLSYLRAGIQNEDYSHVLSFRRQIFVTPDATIELPSSLVLKYEETSYRIFLTYDDQACFKCRQTGHIASQCTMQQQVSPNSDLLTEPIDAATTYDAATTDDTATTGTTSDNMVTETATHKRSNPSDDSPVNEPSLQEVVHDSFNRALKKVRPNDSTESLTGTLELLEPVQVLCSEADPPFPLPFPELLKFMEDVLGESDILPIAWKYTDDITGLQNQLYKIYPLLSRDSIRNRCLKTQRKLNKAYTLYLSLSSLDRNDPETY